MKNLRLTAIMTQLAKINNNTVTLYVSEVQQFDGEHWLVIQTLVSSNLASLMTLQKDVMFNFEMNNRPLLKIIK